MYMKKESGIAVASFVIALVSYPIAPLLNALAESFTGNSFVSLVVGEALPTAAFILGLLAFRDIRKNDKYGKGYAIAGIIISSFIVLILLGIYILFGRSRGFFS